MHDRDGMKNSSSLGLEPRELVIDAAAHAAPSEFVLRIRRLSAGFSSRLSGTVEHPASGTADGFNSLGELAAFIDRALTRSAKAPSPARTANRRVR